MMKKFLFTLTLLATLVSALAVPALSSTYYVALTSPRAAAGTASGDSTQAGTQLAPKTLSWADINAVAGDEVVLLPGDYGTLAPQNPGTAADAQVVFRALTPGTVTVSRINVDTCDYVRIADISSRGEVFVGATADYVQLVNVTMLNGLVVHGSNGLYDGFTGTGPMVVSGSNDHTTRGGCDDTLDVAISYCRGNTFSNFTWGYSGGPPVGNIVSTVLAISNNWSKGSFNISLSGTGSGADEQIMVMYSSRLNHFTDIKWTSLNNLSASSNIKFLLTLRDSSNDNWFTRCTFDMAGSHATSVAPTNPGSMNCGRDGSVGPLHGNHWVSCLFKNSTSYDSQFGSSNACAYFPSGIGGACTYYQDDTFLALNGTTVQWAGYSTSLLVDSLVVQNCTFAALGGGSPVFFGNDNIGGRFVFKGNLVYGSSRRDCVNNDVNPIRMFGEDGAVSAAIDYNYYFVGGGTSQDAFKHGGYSCRALDHVAGWGGSSWQTVSGGKDSHSSWIDPKFTNVTISNYNLTPGISLVKTGAPNNRVGAMPPFTAKTSIDGLSVRRRTSLNCTVEWGNLACGATYEARLITPPDSPLDFTLGTAVTIPLTPCVGSSRPSFVLTLSGATSAYLSIRTVDAYGNANLPVFVLIPTYGTSGIIDN